MTLTNAVVIGGWQTDRERAYVAVTRARDSTDIHVAREDLGEEGMDAGAIESLAERIEISNAQQPSIAHAERDAREMTRAPESHEREPPAADQHIAIEDERDEGLAI